MNRLIVSAPFGNYLSFPHAVSTLGTYTARRRAGVVKRWWRVLRTVRYYSGIGAWKNRLGLPNPGIDVLTRELAAGKILSVAGHCDRDWQQVFAVAFAKQPLVLELNVSCPNYPGEDTSDCYRVFRSAAVLGDAWAVPVIVKLPPLGYAPLVRLALDAGLRGFHCCNTIPTPGGGLSGKPLQPFSLEAVRYVRDAVESHSHKIDWLVGGGGVTHQADADRFLAAGATHVSVASVLFNPLNWRRVARMAKTLAVSS